MKRAGRRWRTTAVVGATLLLATACGNADDTSGGDDPDTGSTATQADADTTESDAGDAESEAAEPDGEPITIGVIEDRTGPGSFFSQQATSVLRVAVERTNVNGGVLGRPLELVFEDDQADSTLSASLARKMIEDGAVAIFSLSGSASAIQIKPVLAEEQVVGIAPTNLNTDIVSGEDGKWSFMVANPISDIATVYTDAYAEVGIESVGFAYDDDATLEGLTQGLMIPQFEEAGIEIPAAEALPIDASDITAEVLRIQEANPDAVFMASFGGPLEPMFYNTMQQLGYEAPRFSLASIGNMPDTWGLADEGALDGLVYAGSISTENELVPELDAILSEELDDYVQMTAFHAQAWDAVRLLVAAIEDAGAAEGPAIRDALESVSIDATFGQPGHVLSYSPDDHMATAGLCGLVLGQFEGNAPGDPWDGYQPSC